MKINAIILGSLFVYCALGFSASSECLPYADPNDYIDNPDTLENGFFECGDPNNLTSYGTDYGFMPPIYWERLPEPSNKNQDCYAEILSSFIPEFLDPDDEDYWEIPAPFEGNSFVLLSTEDVDSNDERDDLERSLIQQKVSFNEGDVLLGAYFFGTTDYPTFNDYFKIYAQLEPNFVSPELVTNGGFDSDTFWTKTGLWTIADPNFGDPNSTDPNFPDPYVARYNPNLLDPEVSTLSQTVPLVPHQTYSVSMDVLTGTFVSGSDVFSVTLGDEECTMTAYTVSTIAQEFTPTSGDTLTISWDNEGTVNIDNVSVKYIPSENFTIVYNQVGQEPNNIPARGSTEDWIPIEYEIGPNQVGSYLLRCEVKDIRDTIYNSYLAVDGLRICRNGRSVADLDGDCDVDLLDYSVISQAWLTFCPDIPIDDPNFPCDPNA